ncbi:MAG: DUF5658 family protein [Candidatus Binatia bacterium]
MFAPLFPSVWQFFIYNLLLQVFDGVLTYQVVSAGVPEANPLVRDAITQYGLVWGLIYWKTIACLLLFSIFALRHRRQTLTLQAFVITGAVYGCVLFITSCAVLLEAR